jgi:ABC-type uncharacterized transport system involved in gliding motility auxiliary subunit
MQMAMMMRRPTQPSQVVINEWDQSFNIVTVDSSAATLPAGLDVLAVIHPQNLSQGMLFAIDQFLLGGKPVFVALDPSSQYFKQQGGQAGMFGGAQANASSDLGPLLASYGLQYDSQKLLGDLENGTDLQNNQTRQASRHSTWLSLRKDLFSPKAQPTAALNSVLFPEAGAIAPAAGSTLEFTPLIQTSAQTGELASAAIAYSTADQVTRMVTPSGAKTVAALVRGKFTSAFPQGAPAPEKKPDDAASPSPAAPAAAAPALKESSGTSTLLVVTDSDWLFDEFGLQKMNFLGQTAIQPFNDNLAFAANALEFLGGSQDLISIRGKGNAQRPFTVVERMEVAANKKYQQQLALLETRLQEVQTKLGELQGKKTEGNRLVATPEMAQAIEDFRKQQSQLSAERRNIRRALREDIDALENRLLMANLLATPLLLGVFGFWFHRSRRR